MGSSWAHCDARAVPCDAARSNIRNDARERDRETERKKEAEPARRRNRRRRMEEEEEDGGGQGACPRFTHCYRRRYIGRTQFSSAQSRFDRFDPAVAQTEQSCRRDVLCCTHTHTHSDTDAIPPSSFFVVFSCCCCCCCC